MTKEEYLINELKKRYPDEFGHIEFAYFREYENEMLKKRKFEEFLERLNKK